MITPRTTLPSPLRKHTLIAPPPSPLKINSHKRRSLKPLPPSPLRSLIKATRPTTVAATFTASPEDSTPTTTATATTAAATAAAATHIITTPLGLVASEKKGEGTDLTMSALHLSVANFEPVRHRFAGPAIVAPHPSTIPMPPASWIATWKLRQVAIATATASITTTTPSPTASVAPAASSSSSSSPTATTAKKPQQQQKQKKKKMNNKKKKAKATTETVETPSLPTVNGGKRRASSSPPAKRMLAM
eukprot:gene10160-28325_t